MYMRKIIVLIFIFACTVAGCSLPYASGASPTPVPFSDVLRNTGNKYRPTPTPFQPISRTPMPENRSTPLPTVTPTEPNPGADLGFTLPGGQVNILLLGSDWRPNEGYRTDVIMLVSLNPKKGTVTVTSFPRDLYVVIPGIGHERINTSQEFGGFPLTQATFESNFNVPVDYYMMTNFYGFKSIIDTLGGITVNAASTLTDECPYPRSNNGYCTIYAGANVMDGETALWYVRSRHSSSDFDRTRRAQEVILGMFTKLMSLDALNRVPELYSLFASNVETNIPLEMILKLIPLASQVLSNPSIVQRFSITEAETSNYIVPETGAMVLIPDYERIAVILRQALNP